MKRVDSEIRLSATDLSHHLGCRHLTQSDRAAAEGLLVEGARAARAQDIDTLRSVVRQLMSMLPADVAAGSKHKALFRMFSRS